MNSVLNAFEHAFKKIKPPKSASVA